MTPYFSGGSTLNGTPGGDRWARVLCGQIGWLSESLHLVADYSGSLADSGRVLLVHEFENANSWKARKNPAPPKAHHETHISPATATTSRRRTKNHVPRVSPYSPASIDIGFVEIGLAQLSPSVKTTNSMSHTRTHTDRLIK